MTCYFVGFNFHFCDFFMYMTYDYKFFKLILICNNFNAVFLIGDFTFQGQVKEWWSLTAREVR